MLICSDSNGRKESIRQLFEESNSVASQHGKPLYPLKPESFEGVSDFIKSNALFGLVTAQLFNGFTWPAENLIIVTEAELFTATARQRRKGKESKSADPDMLFKDLSELKIGDPVVHSDHGIGRYQGLVLLNLAPPKEEPIFEEFLHLVYAKDATLYVPVQQLQMVTRYAGSDPDSAPLHQLGSGQWDKARRKAAQQIRDTIKSQMVAKDATGNAIFGDTVNQVQIEPNVMVDSGVKFADAFGAGGAFATPELSQLYISINQFVTYLDQKSQGIATTQTAGTVESGLNTAFDQLTMAEQISGGISAQVDASKTAMSAFGVELASSQSTLLDTDMAEATAAYTRSQTLLNAAQAMFAKLQSSNLFSKL